ncbi:proline-specific peptidase [Myriangium duriaei CBS 260.36]|uniref:Proline-specific peptidase n=1 Tax=Myriangium duriaei CBS 260.36 TaxID=1168546 RepID=A0A9P4IPD6_9PEZI|nr:proline-specific peptidase [Myriangium duriaei CBS 260.36]
MAAAYDETPFQEGEAIFKSALFNKECHTAYKIFGSLSCGVAPVVCLHGGPAAGHDYLLPFARLWSQFGIPVVLYDQIGCGRSTHFQEKAGDGSFWNENLFIAELENLLEHLELRDDPGFQILGHSWGAMLGVAYASSQPRGLRKLVLASGTASEELYTRTALRLRESCPTEIQESLCEGERTGDFENENYQKGAAYFASLTRWRNGPVPDVMKRSTRNMRDDPTVYRTMFGRNPAYFDGSLRGWSSISRLPKITVPTLIYNGEFDSSSDDTQVPFFEIIPRVRWVTLAGGCHVCHLEEGPIQERVFQTVGNFLTQPEHDN